MCVNLLPTYNTHKQKCTTHTGIAQGTFRSEHGYVARTFVSTSWGLPLAPRSLFSLSSSKDGCSPALWHYDSCCLFSNFIEMESWSMDSLVSAACPQHYVWGCTVSFHVVVVWSFSSLCECCLLWVHIIHPPYCWWTCGHFRFGVITNSASGNILHVSLGTDFIQGLEFLVVGYMFRFPGCRRTVFQRGGTNLHSHQKHTRVRIALRIFIFTVVVVV